MQPDYNSLTAQQTLTAYRHTAFATKDWQNNGLNMQHVFDRSAIPDDLFQPLAQSTLDANNYNQVILIASAGKSLWQALKLQPDPSPSDLKQNDFLDKRDHPVDEFSQQQFDCFMATHAAGSDYKIVYPKHQPPFFHLNLQSFGELAGWHHSSPFKVGINTDVGSWFAYRLLILANTEFKPSSKVNSQSPCVSCPSSHHDQVLDLQTDLTDQSNSNSQLDSYPQSVQQTKPCVKQCPVNALTDQGDYDWKLCFNYRKQKHSLCQDRCLARMACPVAQQHAYTLEQIQYHYNLSRKHLL